MTEELQKKVIEKDVVIGQKDAVINEQSFAIDRISVKNKALKRR